MYVKNRMTSNPYTISPDATIAEALDLMRNNNIRRLPVVKNGKLVGIVTEKEMQEGLLQSYNLSIFEMNYLSAKQVCGMTGYYPLMPSWKKQPY